MSSKIVYNINMYAKTGELIGAPQGLFFPLPDEDTSRYLKGNFMPDFTREDMVDYAVFATALAALSDEPRRSFMPNQRDFHSLSQHGYGPSAATIDREFGGISPLQVELGFYPRSAPIELPRLERRISWIMQSVLPEICDLNEGGRTRLKDILEWGAVRNLTPGPSAVKTAYGGSTGELRDRLNLYFLNNSSMPYKNELLRIGAEVIRRHGGPMASDQVNAFLDERFTGDFAYHAGREFGSIYDFWKRLGYYYGSKKPTQQGILSAALRAHYANLGVDILTVKKSDELSKGKRMPDESTITTVFSGRGNFREGLAKEIDAYERAKMDLVSLDIRSETVDLLLHAYTDLDNYLRLMLDNKELLVRLGDGSTDSRFLLSIIKNGIDLNDEEVKRYQIEDAVTIIRRIVGKSKARVIGALKLIPLIDPQETYEEYLRIKRLQQEEPPITIA